MPIIGVSTYSLFLKMTSLEAIRFAAAEGFGGVEIYTSPYVFTPDGATEQDKKAIRSIGKKKGLSYAVHFAGGNDLANVDKFHLAESRRKLRKTIEFCHEIGGGVVVVHPAQEPRMSIHKKHPLTQYPKYTLPNLREDALARFKESLNDGAIWAKRADVLLGLENYSHVPNCLQTRYEDLVEWVTEIGNPALQITLDTGHANLEGGVREAIGIFGPRIVHVHLNDNNGKSSAHGELGAGTIRWDALRPFLRSFDGMLCIEILGFDDLEGSVLRSKAFMEKLLQRESCGANVSSPPGPC
ncbi:MAG TPA: sugar phosphate isomerase/epimerase family protein [Syntrophales bacterium]|nr:sugar phosphate isomerase/epimerase family protein [Syntrophales bacterium]